MLHGIDFAVAEGGVTALLGANGAGKTTTLRAICGLVRTHGRDPLRGQRDRRLAHRGHRRGCGIAHVPDGRGTFVRSDGRGEPAARRLHAPGRGAVRADFDRVFGYFPRLAERRRQQAGTLSGGEQQMLAIARALLLRPAPADARRAVVRPGAAGRARRSSRSCGAIKRDEGVSILMVEQNAALALDLADHA